MELFWGADVLGLVCAWVQWADPLTSSWCNFRAVTFAKACTWWQMELWALCPIMFQKCRKNVGYLRIWGWREAWQSDAQRQSICTQKALLGMWHNVTELAKLITRMVGGRTAQGQVRCSVTRKEKQGNLNKTKQDKTLNTRGALVLAFSMWSRSPSSRGRELLAPALSPSLCSPGVSLWLRTKCVMPLVQTQTPLYKHGMWSAC